MSDEVLRIVFEESSAGQSRAAAPDIQKTVAEATRHAEEQRKKAVGQALERERSYYSAAAGGIGRLGMAGLAVGAGAAGLAAPFAFTEGAAMRASRLSPEVALAASGAQVAAQRRDLTEAQVLGPSLAKYLEAQTSALDSIHAILLPIKEVVVDVVASVMKVIAGILKDIHDMLVSWGWLEAAKEDPLKNLIDQFVNMDVFGAQPIPKQLEDLKKAADALRQMGGGVGLAGGIVGAF